MIAVHGVLSWTAAAAHDCLLNTNRSKPGIRGESGMKTGDAIRGLPGVTSNMTAGAS